MPDPYKVLSVSRTANLQEIKGAYRKLVKELHPDQYADNPLNHLAEERLKEVNEAYKKLLGFQDASSFENATYSTEDINSAAVQESIEELAKRTAVHVSGLIDSWCKAHHGKGQESAAGKVIQKNVIRDISDGCATSAKRWWAIEEHVGINSFNFNTKYGNYEGTLLMLSETGEFGKAGYSESGYMVVGAKEAFNPLVWRTDGVELISTKEAIELMAKSRTDGSVDISSGGANATEKKYDAVKCAEHIDSGKAEEDLRNALLLMIKDYTPDYLESTFRREKESRLERENHNRIVKAQEEIQELSRKEIYLPLPPVASIGETLIGEIVFGAVILALLAISFEWQDIITESLFRGYEWVYLGIRIAAGLGIAFIFFGWIASIPIAIANYLINAKLQSLWKVADPEHKIEKVSIFNTPVYRAKSANLNKNSFQLELVKAARKQADMPELSSAEAGSILSSVKVVNLKSVLKTMTITIIVLVIGLGLIFPTSPFGSLIDSLKPLFNL